MENRDDIQKELSELSPLLSKLKMQLPSTQAPENYFDHLPDQVWERLQEQVRKTPAEVRVARGAWWKQWIQGLQILLQPQYALTLASVAVLVVAAFFFFRPKADTDIPTPLAALTAEDAANYVVGHIDEFDLSLLVEATEFTPTQVESPTLQKPAPGDTSLDNYLEEIIDDIDIEDLENLL